MERTATGESLSLRLFPFLAGLPLFVNVLGAGLIRMGKVRSVSYHESGQTLPVGLFVVVLLSFFLVLRSLAAGAIRIPRIPYARSMLGIAGAFVYANVFAFMVGQVSAVNLTNVLFLVQVIVPISVMFIVMHVAGNDARLATALAYASIGVVLGVLATICINYMNFGSRLLGCFWIDNYRGIGIYQLYGYVPNVFAAFTPILLMWTCISSSRAKKLAAAVALVLTLFTICHLPSLMAILISCFGLSMFVLGGVHLKLFRFPLLALVVTFVVPLVVLLFFPHSVMEDAFSLLLDSSSTTYQGSVGHRLGKIVTDGSTLLLSPVVGRAYRADYGSNLPGLVESRIAKPHNQFLDIGLRSGLPALVLFIVMISIPVLACIRGLRIPQAKEDKMVGLALLSALVPSITLHNMVLVPYTQPYSAIVLYMLGGLALSYYGIMRRLAG